MSAYIVDKAHIDALVQAALGQRDPLRWYDTDVDALLSGEWEHDRRVHREHIRQCDDTSAHAVGVMLWTENLKSVAARYPEDKSGERPGPSGLTDDAIFGYRFPIDRREILVPVEILKAIAGYEYQTCEHRGWPTSEAKRFCDALKESMIRQLPGYDDAAWEITGEPVLHG